MHIENDLKNLHSCTNKQWSSTEGRITGYFCPLLHTCTYWFHFLPYSDPVSLLFTFVNDARALYILPLPFVPSFNLCVRIQLPGQSLD